MQGTNTEINPYYYKPSRASVSASVCSVATDRTVLHIATKPSRADWGGTLASLLEGLNGGAELGWRLVKQ